MSDKLWSPAMRKWVGDARLHGLDLGFERTGKRRESGWEGGTSVGRAPPLPPTGSGVMFMNIKVAALTILNFGKSRGIFHIQ